MTTPGVFTLQDDDFEAIRGLVRATAGISLSDSRRSLVVARLAKRLRHHGYTSFREYHEHLRKRDPGGTELLEMINCITTNKTEFFREPHHFDWLRERLLPELRDRSKARGAKRIRVWSAGCSTGQEPYSIAMVLADALANSEWDVRVLASDIDTNVLATAQAGEYDAEEVAAIPEALRRKYLAETETGYSVVPAIRDAITFRRINFVEEPWPIRARFDVIFCRNVTIYFDRETQARLYERFVAQIVPNGYLVAGHSENLHWLGHLLRPIGDTVYRAMNGTRTSRAPKGASARPPRASVGPKGRSRRPPGPSQVPKAPGRAPARRSSAPPARELAVHSGGLHVSGERMILHTVLGSCVAGCLFDPEARVGGMNHFMLPDGCADNATPMRFGAHAMEALLSELVKLGAVRSRVRAKIFGGCHVLRTTGPRATIPDANVAFVRSYLAQCQIPIVAERVGGDLPMLVRFQPHTGRAFVRIVENAVADVAINETRYRRTLNSEARQSEGQIRAAERGGT